MAKCKLCGFDLDEAAKKPEPGRQWAQSFELYDDVWICGSCLDAIRDRD